jgi:radical SAM protein with 4Fe4S-binding SPASM domain
MDSHKLIFHPQRVSDWLSGVDVYPLTVEISLSGACNHRCIFCGLDYLGYRPLFLDKELILSNLRVMRDRGVRAIVLAGEGEPLLNRQAPEIIKGARATGLDVGLSTNGVLFDRPAALECIPSLAWIRFSVNGAGEEQYRVVHRGRNEDFDRVLRNIADAVDAKGELRLDTSIGVQMVLIPENSGSFESIAFFAKRLREIGVDYFAIKPFSKHPQSICSLDQVFDYAGFSGLETCLRELESDRFQIIFRSNSMKKLKERRRYEKCLGLPFFAFIDAAANVFPCVAYLGKDEFSLGNLEGGDFQQIWEGTRRKAVMDLFSRMDVSGCRELCRLDEINGYLHDLVNPGAHVNFI